jgi:hypothetical protein
MRLRRAIGLALVALWCVRPAPASAYGVLAHQAIVDAAWARSIVPMLRARFHPSAAALQKARAFAYGGSVIQDVGYYPFSSRFYGDLTHYVRSGDFVAALLDEARTVDEYAFALGALAHYAADNVGHPRAVNASVPLMFPKDRDKYGDRVTYEDDPTAHVRTEFAFDVVQVAGGAYLSDEYRDHIGFNVAKPVLERAFRRTYGLELRDVFVDLDRSIGTFRWAVKTAIPEMTKVAWDTRRDEIARLTPGATRETFLFNMSRADYEAAWGAGYDRPNVWHRILSWIVRVLPKIGPLKSLAYKTPTPEAERLFVESFTATVTEYRRLLSRVASGRPALENRNFDTGREVRLGDYRLADEAYAELLDRCAKAGFTAMTRSLRANILGFYGNASRPPARLDKDLRKAWPTIRAELASLARRAPGLP